MTSKSTSDSSEKRKGGLTKVATQKHIDANQKKGTPKCERKRRRRMTKEWHDTYRKKAMTQDKGAHLFAIVAS